MRPQGRSTRMLVLFLGMLFPVLLLTACSEGPGSSQNEDSELVPLKMTVLPTETAVRQGSQLSIVVTLKNGSDQDELWGSGSSRCRLSLMVVAGEEHYPAGPPRACTMDMVQYHLNAGAEYSETLAWDGTVFRDGRPEMLSPGEYEVYGQGGETRSDSVLISLQAER